MRTPLKAFLSASAIFVAVSLHVSYALPQGKSPAGPIRVVVGTPVAGTAGHGPIKPNAPVAGYPGPGYYTVNAGYGQISATHKISLSPTYTVSLPIRDVRCRGFEIARMRALFALPYYSRLFGLNANEQSLLRKAFQDLEDNACGRGLYPTDRTQQSDAMLSAHSLSMTALGVTANDSSVAYMISAADASDIIDQMCGSPDWMAMLRAQSWEHAGHAAAFALGPCNNGLPPDIFAASGLTPIPQSGFGPGGQRPASHSERLASCVQQSQDSLRNSADCTDPRADVSGGDPPPTETNTSNTDKDGNEARKHEVQTTDGYTIVTETTCTGQCTTDNNGYITNKHSEKADVVTPKGDVFEHVVTYDDTDGQELKTTDATYHGEFKPSTIDLMAAATKGALEWGFNTVLDAATNLTWGLGKSVYEAIAKERSRQCHGTDCIKQCANFSRATSFQARYQMSNTAQPSVTDSGQQSGFNAYDVLAYCMCPEIPDAFKWVANLGFGTSRACMSDEGKLRADCMRHPFGPDDKPSPLCAAMLESDMRSQTGRACGRVLCPAMYSRVIVKLAPNPLSVPDCGCASDALVFGNGSASVYQCHVLDCGTGASCVLGHCSPFGSSLLISRPGPTPTPILLPWPPKPIP